MSDAPWPIASAVTVLASVAETAASIVALASPVGSGTTVEVSGEEAAISLAGGLVGVDFGHHSDRFRAPQGF